MSVETEAIRTAIRRAQGFRASTYVYTDPALQIFDDMLWRLWDEIRREHASCPDDEVGPVVLAPPGSATERASAGPKSLRLADPSEGGDGGAPEGAVGQAHGLCPAVGEAPAAGTPDDFDSEGAA